MDDNWIYNTIKKNKGKSFVKRIIKKDAYKPLDNGDGTHSTHSMEWASADGKYFVYPTVLMNQDGNLQRFSSDEAWEMAHGTGNVIAFDNPDEAAFFSENYKRMWEKDFKKTKSKKTQ